MSNFERSKSEIFNGKPSTKTRKGISENVHNDIEKENRRKEAEQRLAERAEKVGRPGEHLKGLILQGSQDRIQAVPYDSNKYENKTDQRAYEEGFYEHGNRELFGKINILSNEQLQKIGANDYISEVDLNTIHNDVKNNEFYTQGYMMASIFSESKGKGRK